MAQKHQEMALNFILERMGRQISHAEKTDLLRSLPGMSSALNQKQVVQILAAGFKKLQDEKTRQRLLNLQPGESITFKRPAKYFSNDMRTYTFTYTGSEYMFSVAVKNKLSSDFGNKKRKDIEFYSNWFGTFKPAIRLDSTQPALIMEHTGEHWPELMIDVHKDYNRHQKIAAKSKYFVPFIGLEEKKAKDPEKKKMVLRQPFYTKNLQQLIHYSNFGPQERLRCMRQLIEVIKTLHANHWEYSDLRTENIYFDDKGDIKILNLSSVRNFGDDMRVDVVADEFTPDWVLLKQHLMQKHGKDFYDRRFHNGINYELLRKNWKTDIGNLVQNYNAYFITNKDKMSEIQQAHLYKRIMRMTNIRDCSDAEKSGYISKLSEKIRGERDIYALGCIMEELCHGTVLSPPNFIANMAVSDLHKTPNIEQVAKDFVKYSQQEELKFAITKPQTTKETINTIADLMDLAIRSVKDKKINPSLSDYLGKDNTEIITDMFAIKAPRLAEKHATINSLIKEIKASKNNNLIKNILLLTMNLYKQQVLHDAASKSKSWALFTNLYNAYNMRGIKHEIAAIKKKLLIMDSADFSSAYTDTRNKRLKR